MTMKERIALAIYKRFEDRPQYAQAQMCGPLADELADAALVELRAPSKAMRVAMGQALWGAKFNDWNRIFGAAIDAADTEETA